MSLFVILTVITFVDAYKSRLISLILKLIPKDKQVRLKNEEIATLEKELSLISMVNEFAKYSKLQRKINKLREEKKNLVKNHAFKVMKIKYILTTTMYVIIMGCMISLIWLYRSEPVVKVPAHWLSPVSSFFDWSNYTPGTITLPCWIAISSSATKTIAKHF